MWLDLKEQIAVEEAQIEKLFESHAPLLEQDAELQPTQIELSALAAFLDTLYSEIENFFRRITIELGGKIPAGEAWHQQLLLEMTRSTEQRPRVISDELQERLMVYLRFRHLFRNLYLYDLDWEQMKPLVLQSEELFTDLRAELAVFVARMDERMGQTKTRKWETPELIAPSSPGSMPTMASMWPGTAAAGRRRWHAPTSDSSCALPRNANGRPATCDSAGRLSR